MIYIQLWGRYGRDIKYRYSSCKTSRKKTFNMVEFVNHLNEYQAQKICEGFSVLKGFINYEI